jgi:hypothetical protein
VTAAYGVPTATGVLEELRGLVPLTVAGAAERFAARGWTPGGRSRSGGDVPTGWEKDGVQAWIRSFGDPTGRAATGEGEYIALRAWDLDGRGLVAGAVQHDGDLPVMALITLEQPAASVRTGK